MTQRARQFPCPGHGPPGHEPHAIRRFPNKYCPKTLACTVLTGCYNV